MSENDTEQKDAPDRITRTREALHKSAVAVRDADDLLRATLQFGSLDARSHQRLVEARGLLAEWRAEVGT